MRKNRRKGLASIGKHGYVGSKLKICKTTTYAEVFRSKINYCHLLLSYSVKTIYEKQIWPSIITNKLYKF